MANEIIEDAKRFIRERNRLRYGIVGNDQAHITATEMADFATGCLTDAHADLKAKCDAMERILVDARRIQFDSGGTIARLLYGEDAFWYFDSDGKDYASPLEAYDDLLIKRKAMESKEVDDGR